METILNLTDTIICAATIKINHLNLALEVDMLKIIIDLSDVIASPLHS